MTFQALRYAFRKPGEKQGKPSALQVMADNVSNSSVRAPEIEGSLFLFPSADRGVIKCG